MGPAEPILAGAGRLVHFNDIPGAGCGGAAQSRRVQRHWPMCSSMATWNIRPQPGPGLAEGLVCPYYCIRLALADGGGGSPPGGCATTALWFLTSYLPRFAVHVIDIVIDFWLRMAHALNILGYSIFETLTSNLFLSFLHIFSHDHI
jgi:hypothetical protein